MRKSIHIANIRDGKIFLVVYRKSTSVIEQLFVMLDDQERGSIMKNRSRKKMLLLAKCSRLIDAHDTLKAMNRQHFFQSPHMARLYKEYTTRATVSSVKLLPYFIKMFSR